MKNLSLLTAMLLVPAAFANEAHHPEPSHQRGKVAAVGVKSARPVHANELVQSNGTSLSFVDSANTRIELAPHSVGEFKEGGPFHLLRGSVFVESHGEGTLLTTSAKLNFAGRVVVSYDHKEKSTSAFVLEGQARIVNAHDDTQSLRLDRFRGATMVVGEVIPQLIRQLDVGSLDGWLKGYAWSDETRSQWLSSLPDASLAAKPAVPAHLEEVKLENYFSAIEPDDEVEAPDYYEKKFADPDKTVAEANSVKTKAKELKPEEAALISLPSTKIDLGFDLVPQVLTLRQKDEETRSRGPAPLEPGRSLASVKEKRAKPKAVESASHQDPEIAGVLSRLRNIQSQASEPVVSPQIEFRATGSNSRGPASIPSDVVPDAVYDYSQNF